MGAREIIAKAYVKAWDQHIGFDGADPILAALKAAGYRVVPVEPTEKMLRAGDDSIEGQYSDHPQWEDAKDVAEGLCQASIYRAMIAASEGE